jgi:hypothetical protein
MADAAWKFSPDDELFEDFGGVWKRARGFDHGLAARRVTATYLFCGL